MKIQLLSISTSLVSTLIAIVLVVLNNSFVVVVYGKSVRRLTPRSWDDAAAAEQVTFSAPNFESTRTMRDGERDRRAHYGSVTARETSALDSGNRRLRLLQVTDGNHFVQAIYDGNLQLKDCEYVRDRRSVAHFLAQVRQDFEFARTLELSGAVDANVTLRLLEDGDVTQDAELRRLVDYDGVRTECKDLHRRMKQIAHLAQGERQDEEQVSRRKRELFIYPGTNWCGAGSTSNGFTDLGWYAAADRCCRQHDHCPKTIQGLTTDFNLFNYRFHTISDCECDERFRTCLKMVDNEHSNLVGKIFFNVVQMKCFKLKPEKVCLKRSWWGRCLKNGRKVTAQLKDPLPY